MVPIFHCQDAHDVTFSNFTFNGRDKYQSVSWGKGYHNLIGCWDSSGIVVQNITGGNSQGDIARLIDCSNIVYAKNKIKRCGHDGLFGDRCSGITAYDNVTYTRTNSALRCKGSHNVSFFDNFVYGTSEAYSPGIQVENSRTNETSSGIRIYNNWISDTYGPGIWIAGHMATSSEAATDLLIQNNRIIRCGQMPAVNGLNGVGGIVCDGWSDVVIQGNTIDSSYGYGILFGKYLTSSAGSGYKATVKNNSITNTRLCNTGVGGYGVASAGKYDLTVSGNCYYHNVENGITGSYPVYVDPSYDSQYYSSYGASGKPISLILTCSSKDITEFTSSLSQKYNIYKKV